MVPTDNAAVVQHAIAGVLHLGRRLLGVPGYWLVFGVLVFSLSLMWVWRIGSGARILVSLSIPWTLPILDSPLLGSSTGAALAYVGGVLNCALLALLIRGVSAHLLRETPRK